MLGIFLLGLRAEYLLIDEGEMYRLVLLFLANSLLYACASSKVNMERAREANLMPEEIASSVVDKYTYKGFAKSPTLLPKLARHPACSDPTPKPVSLKDTFIVWTKDEVSINTFGGASFWCGSGLHGVIKVTSIEDRDELVDALLSLGSKTLEASGK